MKYIRQKLEIEYHQLNLWGIVSFIFGILFYFNLNEEPSVIHILLGSGVLLLFSR